MKCTQDYDLNCKILENKEFCIWANFVQILDIPQEMKQILKSEVRLPLGIRNLSLNSLWQKRNFQKVDLSSY